MGLKRLEKQRHPANPASEVHVEENRSVSELLPANAPDLRVNRMS